MSYKAINPGASIRNVQYVQDADKDNWLSHKEGVRVRADVVTVLETSTNILLETDAPLAINDDLVIDGQRYLVLVDGTSHDISSLGLTTRPVNVSHFLDISGVTLDVTDDIEIKKISPIIETVRYDAGDYVIEYPVIKTLARVYNVKVNIPISIDVVNCNLTFVR